MPLIYVLDMTISYAIQMLLGTNFIRAMNGGIRIEGDEITIYKKITNIRSQPQAEVSAITTPDDEDFFGYTDDTFGIMHEAYSLQTTAVVGSTLQTNFKPIIQQLTQQGFIGEEPLRHWQKNGELCTIEIINPDITIQDKPLKHVTPAMEDAFKKHIDALL